MRCCRGIGSGCASQRGAAWRRQRQQQPPRGGRAALSVAASNVAAARLITSPLGCSSSSGHDGSSHGNCSPQLARVAPYLIGVCGGTASGKTSVCNKIITGIEDISLRHRGILSLPQDCFYRNLSADEAANVTSFNFDHPDAFSLQEMMDTLTSLKEGRPARIPIYDFVTSARLGEATHVEAADVVLFDGILAFYWPQLRQLFDLRIFVDADADTRLARRIRRDIVERGRDVIAVLQQYEATVKPSFEQFTLPSKAHADIIIPRGADNGVAISLLLQHIRFQLTGRAAAAAAVGAPG